MEKLEKFWKQIKQLIQCCKLILVLLVLSVICYLLSYKWGSVFDGNQALLDFVARLGDVFSISFVTSFLFRTLKYNNYFKDALLEVIYKKDYLENRDDLESIWRNVSMALFSKRFVEIHEPLLDVIYSQYLPKENTISYYTDIIQIINIQWKNVEENIIQIEEKIQLNVHTKNEDKCLYDGKYCLTKGNENKIQELFKLDKYEVDGIPQKLENIQNVEETDDEYIVTCKVSLKDSKSYNIMQAVTRYQNLSVDHYHGYSARYLIRNMDVDVSFPDDLEVDFYKSGTINDFKTLYCSQTRLRKQYEGIILKRQGYIMTFHKR